MLGRCSACYRMICECKWKKAQEEEKEAKTLPAHQRGFDVNSRSSPTSRSSKRAVDVRPQSTWGSRPMAGPRSPVSSSIDLNGNPKAREGTRQPAGSDPNGNGAHGNTPSKPTSAPPSQRRPSSSGVLTSRDETNRSVGSSIIQASRDGTRQRSQRGQVDPSSGNSKQESSRASVAALSVECKHEHATELSGDDTLCDQEALVAVKKQQVETILYVNQHVSRPQATSEDQLRARSEGDDDVGAEHSGCRNELTRSIDLREDEAARAHSAGLLLPHSPTSPNVQEREEEEQQGKEQGNASCSSTPLGDDELAKLQLNHDDSILPLDDVERSYSHLEDSGWSVKTPSEDGRETVADISQSCQAEERADGVEDVELRSKKFSSSSFPLPVTASPMWKDVEPNGADSGGLPSKQLHGNKSEVNEEDLLEWVHSVVGRRYTLEELRDGHILCKIVDNAYDGTFPMRRIYQVATHDYQRERNFHVLHFFLNSLGVKTEVNVASLWEAGPGSLLKFFDWLRSHCEDLQRQRLRASHCSPPHGLWKSLDDPTYQAPKANVSWRTFPILPIASRGLQARATDQSGSNTFTKLTQADGLVRVAGCHKLESVNSPARRPSFPEPCPYCSSTVDKKLICEMQELEVTQQLARLLDSIRANDSNNILVQQSLDVLESSLARTESLLSQLLLQVNPPHGSMRSAGQDQRPRRSPPSPPSTHSFLRAKMLSSCCKAKNKVFKLRRERRRSCDRNERREEEEEDEDEEEEEKHPTLWHTARSHSHSNEEQVENGHVTPARFSHGKLSSICLDEPSRFDSPPFLASPVSQPFNRRKRMLDASSNEDDDDGEEEEEEGDFQGCHRRLGDVGLIVGFDQARNCLTVQRIRAGSAAEKCGAIEEGDQLVGINGSSELHSPGEVEQRLLGEHGSLVRVRLKRQWNIFDVTLSRDSVVALWI
ncbi:hypothetical protein GUITHDRAFT_104370 [Guillardia theta CCMP2712]|uniref:PDZ domain-containing protein n=1 Tax=Guillardia theta (strain CCMP2712) TaxID=905079 RepID=L1JP54_GUITC|nr:hypothetical protein GUITHDRAFT_104370 [Guillardia theta CCMP2712]EKX49975.1 hypothetical protein GUITHDRAFT_104370 [Guillardia theta CCMP2712]|eukprot:XP_005836955.1 hypothetical protein GUITHDRAFT_104370 [Guillardia theta CCMP2712]